MAKSQAATENLIIYGMAIVIIAAAVAALFYTGVLNPSSYTSRNTASGFSGFAVYQQCDAGGTLAFSITNTNDYPVEVTAINTTSTLNSSLSSNSAFSIVLQTGESQVFFVPSACPLLASARYSSDVSFTYMTGSSANPGPYQSSGAIAGETSSLDPNLVGSFDGTSSYVSTAYTATISHVTLVAWVKDNGLGSYWKNVVAIDNNTAVWSLDTGVTGVNGATEIRWTSSYQYGCCTVNVGVWKFIVGVWNSSGKTETAYNGTSSSSPGAAPDIISYNVTSISIGNSFPGMAMFSGDIADVQVYNTALTFSQIGKIYSEGIDGAPISGAGLVGWWPLDGNANDFSGENNNGVAYNVQWVSS